VDVDKEIIHTQFFDLLTVATIGPPWCNSVTGLMWLEQKKDSQVKEEKEKKKKKKRRESDS